MTDAAEPASSPQTPAPSPPEETKMEFHKPKPVHNWREFLSEVGVVVLGVCIALAGEQTVEALHWRSEVNAARGIIATEMSYNLEGAIWRVRTLGCGERRLDALANTLDEASRTGSLPPLGHIWQSPRHLWRSGAWDSVVASQTATHFPPEQLAQLSSLYKVVQRIEEHAIPESQAWADLYDMVGPGRRLDPAAEAELRHALGHARNDARTMATLSLFLITQAKAMALPFTKSELEKIKIASTQPLSQRANENELNVLNPVSPTSICAPIGPVPSGYGDAPAKEAPAIVDAAAQSLPDFGAP